MRFSGEHREKPLSSGSFWLHIGITWGNLKNPRTTSQTNYILGVGSKHDTLISSSSKDLYVQPNLRTFPPYVLGEWQAGGCW